MYYLIIYWIIGILILATDLMSFNSETYKTFTETENYKAITSQVGVGWAWFWVAIISMFFWPLVLLKVARSEK